MKSIINALKALWAVFKRPSKAAVGIVAVHGLYWRSFILGCV